ncbi:MAG: hypothetical protein IJO60_05550 [Agathobacter sp.]|nr:hypothetical protein [Agathobacter sp.]
MNYQTFIEDVVKHVSASVHNGQKVVVQPVIKNNGMVYDGLIIMDPILNISPTIYLNPYYHRFLNGVSMEDIYEDILNIYYENLPKKDFDISIFRDFEKASKRIAFKLVNKEKNRELLNDVPYVEFQDLVLIFVCIVNDYMKEYATILIHNQHVDFWGVTTEELYHIAMENTPKLLPYKFENLENILVKNGYESLAAFPDCNMYILTNRVKVHGAVCLAYTRLLKRIADFLEDNLIIIPSSIHELLILPESVAKPEYTTEDLAAMITEINETQLTDDEVLSDHAYVYERHTGILRY